MSAIPRELIGRHAGEVVVILGNGPSLNDFDLTDPFFTKNVTIGSNAIGDVFSPSYYVIGDPVAWRKFGKLVRRPSHLLIGEHARATPPGSSLFHYSTADRVGPLTKGRLYHGRTSGILMVHIAYQLGFKFFFLLGIDGYSVKGGSHFYTGGARSTSDPDVSSALEQAYVTLKAEKKFIWNLSRRSVFRNIPLYPTLAVAKQEQEKV